MLNNLFSVTTLNAYIKDKLNGDPNLRGFSVKGEISNLKKHPTGHIYFSIKDSGSSIKVVLFKSYSYLFDPTICDGDEVIVHGYLDVYIQRGEYQIYAQAVEKYGKGQQLLELEQLKKKLAAEGLFDESRKKEINRFPREIAVITAANSAALVDIKTNLLRRYPLVKINVFPSLVQGIDAPKDLIKSFRLAQSSNPTTIIIGRGGGANEDLSAFNNEELVREVANSNIPVISAVGHEIDTTLIDLVSDKRASTPTGAAELATIDKLELIETISFNETRLYDTITQKIKNLKEKLILHENRSFFKNPATMYSTKIDYLNSLKTRLLNSQKHFIDLKIEKLNSLQKEIINVNPEKILRRGFAYVTREDKNIITSINDVKINDNLTITLKDGTIQSKVVKRS